MRSWQWKRSRWNKRKLKRKMVFQRKRMVNTTNLVTSKQEWSPKLKNKKILSERFLKRILCSALWKAKIRKLSLMRWKLKTIKIKMLLLNKETTEKNYSLFRRETWDALNFLKERMKKLSWKNINQVRCLVNLL